MKGRFLINPKESHAEGNIYANKAALVLNWLLGEGIVRPYFSLREVSKETGTSLGLVQKVFTILISKGVLNSEGVRTAKRFFLKKPKQILQEWLDHYKIINKCRMITYHSGFQDREEILSVLSKTQLTQKVALALHSAAEAHGCKNTSLNTVELYVHDSTIRSELESTLQLEPQERGYEVLLIEPYYKDLLKLGTKLYMDIKICPVLLNFIDLYHFPLRGREQAEFMAERLPELKHIYKKK